MISVVIPAFNSEATIREAIESVIIQKGWQTEIVVVDDGSKDKTCAIVDEMRICYVNIKLIRLGISSGRPNVPRNVGVESASGKYICFLDSDDILPLNYFHCVIPLVRKRAIFVGSLKCIFHTVPPLNSSASATKAKGFQLPTVIQSSKNMFSMSGLICSLQIVKSLRFSGSFLEDWRYISRLYELGLTGYLLFSPRVRYRVSNNSLTPRNKLRQIYNIWLFLLEQHSISGAAIRMPFYFLFGGIKLLFEINLNS